MLLIKAMFTSFSTNLLGLRAIDKVLIAIVMVFICFGGAANYVRTHSESLETIMLFHGAVILVWLLLAGSIGYSTLRHRLPLSRYGLSREWGGFLSIVVAAAVTSYQLARTGLEIPADTHIFVLEVVAASMEELIFRAILINLFLKLLAGTRHRVFLSILFSAVIFAFGHIWTTNLSMLIGLFTTSMILGYTYYRLRSILIPAWSHTVFNTSWAGGLIVLCCYVAVIVVDWLFLSRVPKEEAEHDTS